MLPIIREMEQMNRQKPYFFIPYPFTTVPDYYLILNRIQILSLKTNHAAMLWVRT